MDAFDQFDFDAPASGQQTAKTFKKILDLNSITPEEAVDQVLEDDATQIIQNTRPLDSTTDRYPDSADNSENSKGAPPFLLSGGSSLFSSGLDDTNESPNAPVSSSGMQSFLLSDAVKRAKRRLDGEPEKEHESTQEGINTEDATQVVNQEVEESIQDNDDSDLSPTRSNYIQEETTQVIADSREITANQEQDSSQSPSTSSQTQKSEQDTQLITSLTQEIEPTQIKSNPQESGENDEERSTPTFRDTTQRLIDNYEEENQEEADGDDDHFELSQNKPRLSSRPKAIFSDDESEKEETKSDKFNNSKLFQLDPEEEEDLDLTQVIPPVRFDVPLSEAPTQVIQDTDDQTQKIVDEDEERLRRITALAEKKRQLRLLKEQQEREKNGKDKLSQSTTKRDDGGLDQEDDNDDNYRSADEDFPESGFVGLEPVVMPVNTNKFFKKLGIDFTKREFPKIIIEEKAESDIVKEKPEEKYKIVPIDEDEKPVEIIVLDSDDSDADEITPLEKFNVSLKFATKKLAKKQRKAVNSRELNIRELLKLSREQEKKKLGTNTNKRMMKDIEAIQKEFKESDDILDKHFRIQNNLKRKERQERRDKRNKTLYSDDEDDDDYLDDEEEGKEGQDDVPDSDFSDDNEQPRPELQLSQNKRKLGLIDENNEDPQEDVITYADDGPAKDLFHTLAQHELILKRRRVNVIDDDDEEGEDEAKDINSTSLSQFPSFGQLNLSSTTDSIQASDIQTISQLFDQASQRPPNAVNKKDGRNNNNTDIFVQLRAKAQGEVIRSEESFIQNEGFSAQVTYENTQSSSIGRDSSQLKVYLRGGTQERFFKYQTSGARKDEDVSEPVRTDFSTQEDFDLSTQPIPTQVDSSQTSQQTHTQADVVPTQADVAATQKMTRTQKIIKTQRIKIQLSDDEEEDYQQPSVEQEKEALEETDSDDEEERIRIANLFKLQRQQEQMALKQKRKERQAKGLDEVMEDQAEESEDEFAGLGGVEGERDDLDVANSDDEAMYDDITKVKESRAEYVAKHIEQDLKKDEEMNKALLTAIERGGLSTFDFRDPEQALKMLKRENMLRKVAKINAIREKYLNEQENKKKRMNVMDEEDEFSHMLDVNAEVLPDSSDEEKLSLSQDIGNKKRDDKNSKKHKSKKKKGRYDSDSDEDKDFDSYLSQRSDSTTSFNSSMNPTLRSIVKYPSFDATKKASTVTLSDDDDSDSGLVELPTTRVHRIEKLPTLEKDPNEVIITTTSKNFGTSSATVMSLGRPKRNNAITETISPFARVLKPAKKKVVDGKKKMGTKLVSAFRGFKKDDGFD